MWFYTLIRDFDSSFATANSGAIYLATSKASLLRERSEQAAGHYQLGRLFLKQPSYFELR